MMPVQTSGTQGSVVAFASKKSQRGSTMMTDDAGRTSPSSYSPAHWRNIGEVTAVASAISTMSLKSLALPRGLEPVFSP